MTLSKTVQTLQTGQCQSRFLPELTSYRGWLFGGDWEKEEVGGGGSSEQDEIDRV